MVELLVSPKGYTDEKLVAALASISGATPNLYMRLSDDDKISEPRIKDVVQPVFVKHAERGTRFVGQVMPKGFTTIRWRTFNG